MWQQNRAYGNFFICIILLMIFHDLYKNKNTKEAIESPPQALFWKTNIQQLILSMKNHVFFMKSTRTLRFFQTIVHLLSKGFLFFPTLFSKASFLYAQCDVDSHQQTARFNRHLRTTVLQSIVSISPTGCFIEKHQV